MKTLSSSAEIAHALLALPPKSPQLVLIGGCSRAGKSTLAIELQSDLKKLGSSAAILSLDAWIISLDQRKPNANVMERYETDAAQAAVGDLLRGQTVVIPAYDAIARRRLGSRARYLKLAAQFLLVEGVIALASADLRQASTLSIFVDVADDERHRRFLKFYQDEKGLSPSEAQELWHERELDEAGFVKETREFAHIVYRHHVVV